MATTAVSPDFITHVRLLYRLALEQSISGKSVRRGINCYTFLAIPAYTSTVAAVEAFVNETFLGPAGRMVWQESPLWSLPSHWLEKLNLPFKLILIPLVLTDKTFARDRQPYQDMAMVYKIRNDLIHFKMSPNPPKYLAGLSDRRIALASSHSDKDADYAWPHKLSSSEGIRWAHNVACAIVHELVSFFPPKEREVSLLPLAQNFEVIPEAFARSKLVELGVDPDIDYP